MKVKAIEVGEHPSGKWREVGETFDFEGEKLGLWMEPLEKVKETKEVDEPKGYHKVHKGAGKWDVFGPDGEVVPEGDNIKRDDADALIELLSE